MIRRPIVLLTPLLAALAAAMPAGAGTVEVTVRDNEGRALEHRNLAIRPLPVAGQASGSRHGRRWRWHQTDATGRVTFERVDQGSYAIDLVVSSTDPYVRPADNPFAPTPRVTLLKFDEHQTLDVVLWRGVRVTVGLELSDDRTAGFRAIFHHPGSGMTRTRGFPRGATSAELVLPPGVWDVSVEPRPGYLLVALDRDRVPLPGHRARLDLLHEPAATFLTWTYVTPAAIEGLAFTDTGRVAPVEIVARLVEPGPWHPAAVERGGSIFDRVTTSPDPILGTYRMLVPDGRWRVQPQAPELLESDPEAVDLTLAPGQTGQADFVVRMGRSAYRPQIAIEVENSGGYSLQNAAVEVYDLAEPDGPVRSGVTDDHGSVSFEALEAGSYRVIAGHVDYLEGRRELPDYDPKVPERRYIRPVVLPDGAEIRLLAQDPASEPLVGVELSVERVGDDPDTDLQADDVVKAKRVRTAVTDQSGRASVVGFYPGPYRARARLHGERGSRGLIHLSRGGGRPGRQTIDLEISGTEKVELEGRVIPAASLSASLLCADGWDLPDTVAVRVFDAHDARGRELDPRDFDLEDPAQDDAGITFADDNLILTGRGRDGLTVGPFEQGVYYLAVKPKGFDRWTWAFETHDANEAGRLQVDVTLSEVEGAAFGNVDLGLFAIECAPAVDLLPSVAGIAEDPAEGPAEASPRQAFPDVREVKIETRFFDLDADKEIQRRLSITRRDGRIMLRGCPEGRLRLDFTLKHPHLLPEPALSWQVELELDRGGYREIVPEVEALGGSILISAPPKADGSAVLHGPDGGHPMRIEAGEVEFPSLVPGRYRVEVFASEATGSDLLRAWQDLEVRAGQTIPLDVRR